MKQEVRFAREGRCTCFIRASEERAAPDHSPPDGEKREVLLVCALGGKQVELLGAALGGKERRTHHPKVLPRFLAHLVGFGQKFKVCPNVTWRGGMLGAYMCINEYTGLIANH